MFLAVFAARCLILSRLYVAARCFDLFAAISQTGDLLFLWRLLSLSALMGLGLFEGFEAAILPLSALIVGGVSRSVL